MGFIEFKNVSKIYNMGEVEIRALDDINFEIEKGDSSKGFTFPSDTVVYKDWVETKTGKYYLGNGSNLGVGEDYAAGVFYNVKLDDDGNYVTSGETYVGQRVVYTPYQTHPQNHFSTESTSYMIEFYEAAFKTG